MERYVLEADKEEIEAAFGVGSKSEVMFESNYNVMPGNVMPVIIKEDGQNNIVRMKWGLKNSSDSEVRPEIESEQISDSPERNNKIEQQACIIPASGFYKWKETVEDPLPFYLRVISDDVTGFAGIYSTYNDENGRSVRSFAILTMPANALVEPLDDRMPVILKSNEYEKWINGQGTSLIQKEFNADDLLPHMTVFRVPELVNDPSNNSKELIQPIPKLRNYDGADDDG